MTNLYQKLKRFNKEEILGIGKYYAIDGEGFVNFAEEIWDEKKESDCDFVRALVTVVSLLNDRPIGSEHEITVLNDFFNNSDEEKDKMVKILDKYFNEANIKESGYDIVKAYREKISVRENSRSLLNQFQELTLANISSILSPDKIKKLKSLNDTYAYVSTIINGKIKNPKLRKIFIKGNDAKSLILKMGNVNYRFVGTCRGIYNISNSKNELMFQNNITFNNQYSSLEKIAYVYGMDEAKNYVSDTIRNMTEIQDEIYHEKRKNHKTLEDYYKENN